jgi:hypothetical protein
MVDAEKPHVTIQTVKIDTGLLRRLKHHAANTLMTQQDILHTALVEYLDRHEENARLQTKRTKGDLGNDDSTA